MSQSDQSGAAGAPNQSGAKVFVTRRLPESVESRMRQLFDVTLRDDDTPLSEADLCAAAASNTILVPTVSDEITARVIEAGKGSLKLIANFGAGVDHIDLTAAKNAGIPITNTPNVLTEDTADLAMALLLSVPRRLFESEKLLRAGGWGGWSPTFMMGRRIQGKKLGIIGMGRIGRAVARRAQAFGLEIHYHNRHPLPAEVERSFEATYYSDLDDMLSVADFVTVNCPRTRETIHLLNAERIAKMQPHAILVNTARGEIIDEAALADALEAKQIAGAGLDVFENEPKIHPKLLTLDNVTLLPHMGSATLEARVAMGEKVLINIRTFLDGHRLADRVLPGEA